MARKVLEAHPKEGYVAYRVNYDSLLATMAEDMRWYDLLERYHNTLAAAIGTIAQKFSIEIPELIDSEDPEVIRDNERHRAETIAAAAVEGGEAIRNAAASSNAETTDLDDLTNKAYRINAALKILHLDLLDAKVESVAEKTSDHVWIEHYARGDRLRVKALQPDRRGLERRKKEETRPSKHDTRTGWVESLDLRLTSGGVLTLKTIKGKTYQAAPLIDRENNYLPAFDIKRLWGRDLLT